MREGRWASMCEAPRTVSHSAVNSISPKLRTLRRAAANVDGSREGCPRGATVLQSHGGVAYRSSESRRDRRPVTRKRSSGVRGGSPGTCGCDKWQSAVTPGRIQDRGPTRGGSGRPGACRVLVPHRRLQADDGNLDQHVRPTRTAFEARNRGNSASGWACEPWNGGIPRQSPAGGSKLYLSTGQDSGTKSGGNARTCGALEAIALAKSSSGSSPWRDRDSSRRQSPASQCQRSSSW